MTIKRNGDRVILKGGKVSCSCCEAGECCMYPSKPYFNDEYTIEDLPDEVVMNFFGDTAIVSKTENKFTPYEGTFGGGNQASISIDEDEAGAWIVVWGGNSFEAGDCLIKGDGNLTPGNDTIEDQFADTYTVYVNGIADIFDETFTLIRRSLCIWSSDFDEGEPSGVLLTAPQLFSLKWAINVGGEVVEKDDPQNSPIGLYGDNGTEISE